MSLYDDLDSIKSKASEKVAGWSSGIKLLQSQLQLKKAATTAPKRDQIRKASLAPVIDLKSKKDDDIYTNIKPSTSFHVEAPVVQFPIIPTVPGLTSDYDWDVVGEYDPLWPNEYEKVVKELRDQRDRDTDKDDRDKKRDRRRKSRFSEGEDASNSPQVTLVPGGTGFAGRWDDEEDEIIRPEVVKPVRPGVAIAPPPSLQESVTESPPFLVTTPPSSSNSYGASSVAARIMAKYGFKEGQGLGKKEQGMAMALQVEKTSKRGGRIIHEKEIMLPPPPPAGGSPLLGVGVADLAPKPEPSITEIMRSPSKIVLLRNMVGPGEVDEDLEPEVKDECNTKYGDVIKVMIHEVSTLPHDEAVRIFVEFKRIESAIKAVVDLNGRFFGGRTVKAGFYDVEKFANKMLMEM